MALRTEQFRFLLENHRYKQDGEGMCWPALMQAVLHSRGSLDGNRQKLIQEMGTTVDRGTDDTGITFFLNKKGIRWHTEHHCSFDRLVSFTERLPIYADIFASVWDRRVSPGFDEINDPPESHAVAILETPLIKTKRRVHFYDPNTYNGGLLDYSQEEWETWWNDGPPSGLEADNFGNLVPYEPGWVMIVGLSPGEVNELVLE